MSVGGYKSLSTAVFNDITSNNNVENMCSEVNAKVPSNFVCLSDCGLFAGGLSSIKGMSDSIMGNISSFKSDISEHSENIVLIEDNLINKNSNLEDIFISNELNGISNVDVPVKSASNSASLQNNMPYASNKSNTNINDVSTSEKTKYTDEELIKKLESELPSPDEYAKMSPSEQKIVNANIKLLNELKGKSISTISGDLVFKADEADEADEADNRNLENVEGSEISSAPISDSAAEQKFTSMNNGQATTGASMENIEFITQNSSEQQVVDFINLDNKTYMNEIYNDNTDKSDINFSYNFDSSIDATLMKVNDKT